MKGLGNKIIKDVGWVTVYLDVFSTTSFIMKTVARLFPAN